MIKPSGVDRFSNHIGTFQYLSVIPSCNLLSPSLSVTPRCSILQRGADLTEAILNGADLTEAFLNGADLTNADVTKADLTEADLTRGDRRSVGCSRCCDRFANLAGALAA